MFVDHLVDIVNCTHHLHTDSRGKGIRLSLVIMNCWGPKEFVHSKGNLCGENVQCSIGLGSEGVFVVVRTKSVLYNETPLYYVCITMP